MSRERLLRVPHVCLTLLVVSLALAGCSAAEVVGERELSRSEALLWTSLFSRLEVRIDFVEGRAPTGLAIETLEEVLWNVTGKEEISILPPRPIPGYRGDRGPGWDDAGLQRFHEAYYGTPTHAFSENGSAVLHIMYIDGYFADSDVMLLGKQDGVDIYIFADSLREEGPIDSPAIERVERQLVIHEVGHALGLVGCELPMTRDRAAEGCHSTNDESVMFGNMEVAMSDAILDMASEGKFINYEFDADDLRDIEAFRKLAPARGESPAQR